MVLLIGTEHGFVSKGGRKSRRKEGKFVIWLDKLALRVCLTMINQETMRQLVLITVCVSLLAASMALASWCWSNTVILNSCAFDAIFTILWPIESFGQSLLNIVSNSTQIPPWHWKQLVTTFIAFELLINQPSFPLGHINIAFFSLTSFHWPLCYFAYLWSKQLTLYLWFGVIYWCILLLKYLLKISIFGAPASVEVYSKWY